MGLTSTRLVGLFSLSEIKPQTIYEMIINKLRPFIINNRTNF
jgi:hypothetical protein